MPNALIDKYKPSLDIMGSYANALNIRGAENQLAAFPEQQAREAQRFQWEQEDRARMAQMDPMVKATAYLQFVQSQSPAITWDNYPQSREYLQGIAQDMGIESFMLPSTEELQVKADEMKIPADRYFELWKNDALLTAEQKIAAYTAQTGRIKAEQIPTGTPGETERLVGLINGLEDGDPKKAFYLARLKKLTESKQQTIRVNPDGSVEIVEGPAGAQGHKMPATALQQFGEFEAYTKSLDELEEMVRSGNVSTGPFEFINKRLDDWGIMPNKERIQMRNMVARLPGIMYAMRGKQLSDKELEVALDMMPKMKQADMAFRVSLQKFNDYLQLILKGRERAFKEAGYNVPSVSGYKPKLTIDQRGDQLAAEGKTDQEVMTILNIEGYY